MLCFYHRFFAVIIIYALLPSFGYAQSSNIPCPSLDAIHNAAVAINEATYVNHSFIANTPPFAIHSGDFGWFAVVYNIQAVDQHEALSLAKLAMQSVRQMDSLYAINAGGIYVCGYDNRKVEVINNEDRY